MTLNYLPKSFSNPWWSRLLRSIADRNPFYLISALCMLGGCLALTNSLSWISLPLGRLLLLMATINVYEAALIGLALVLIKRGLLRDGKILLVMEAFFLVDVTFLNAEIATANLRLGIFLAIVLFALAVLKLRLVMKALGTALPPAHFIYVAVQIAALLAIPCVLRGIDHGSVSPINFYAVWWIVGLMPIIGELILALWGNRTDAVPTGPARVFVSLPFISLIAHVAILHYVYDVDFMGAMAAPVLLALAIILKRVPAPGRDARIQLFIVRTLLPLAAVMVSLNNPLLLTFSLHPFSSITATPTLLAMTGAYLTYVYCFFSPLATWFLGAGALFASVYLFGPPIATVQRVAWRSWSWSMDVTDWMVPKSLTGWGIISVAASFFFLVLGAAVSFARPKPQVEEIAEVSG